MNILEEHEEMMKMKKAGQLRFWTNVFYEIEKLEAESGETKNSLLKEKYKYLKNLKAKTNNDFYAMLSIRPKIDQKFKDFEAFINRVTKKCWLKDNCMWVYEQKGENEAEMGKGLHCHILFRLDGVKHGESQKLWKQCKYEIVKMIEPFDWIEERGIHISTYPRKDYKNAFNYIRGKKASLEKEKSQEFDIIYREKNNIKEYYGLNELSGIEDSK